MDKNSLFAEDCKFFVDDYVTELKQHLNLSQNAWLVIGEDIKNFYVTKDKGSFSGFLNRIFHNFYQKADASVRLRCLEKLEELETLYKREEFASLDKSTINKLINSTINVYRAELQKKVRSYPNGRGEKFRINRENVDVIRELMEANYYDSSIGLYLKALFEEYTTLPTYVREQIFFADTIEKINIAISRRVKLKLALNAVLSAKGDRKYFPKYYLSPYKIVQDKMNNYNYVIGYSEKIVEQVETDDHGKIRKTSCSLDKQPACFRISNIDKLDVQVSMGAKISKEHAVELDTMLIERGAMFFTSQPIDVKIKFTQKGLELFKKQIYMRPQFYTIDPTDNLIYVFRCAERQAINYFFKFGCDALVMEPADLAQKLSHQYDLALQSYNLQNKN